MSKRGSQIIEVTGRSSAASAASAACDHMRDWWYGTSSWVSMAVIPDKEVYGIDADLCFSYPVTISSDGEWHIVSDLNLSEIQKEGLLRNVKELQEERFIALNR